MSGVKKILYISNVEMSGKYLPGVVEKIKGQVLAFRRADIVIDLLYPTENGLVIIQHDGGTVATYSGAKVPSRNGNFIQKIFHYLRLAFLGSIDFANCQQDIIDSAYEAVYIRFYLPGSGLLRLLNKLKKCNSHLLVFLEYPTLNLKQTFSKDVARQFLYATNAHKINQLNNLSDYIVTVTNENVLFGKPAINMPNGIDLSQIQSVPTPEFDDTIVLLGVASDCAFYHGYDKVILGIHEYKSHGLLPKVKFRIITSLIGHNIESIKRLIAKYSLECEVELVGSMNRQALFDHYKNAHLGVGTLGLHRIGMMSNCSLKHREYAAFGLPFVMSLGDEIFETSQYVMTVERNDDPIDISNLVHFYDRLRKADSNYSASFRASIEKYINWDFQLESLFKVLGKSNSSIS